MKKNQLVKLLRAARKFLLSDSQQVSRRNKLNKKLRHLLAYRVINIRIYFKIDAGDIKGVIEQLVFDNNGNVNHTPNNND